MSLISSNIHLTYHFSNSDLDSHSSIHHLGYSVLRVYATDQDEGTNGKIEYEIQSGATKDLFRILYNGDIETLRSLDRELHTSHQLVVTAKDKGTPSLKSSVVVNINVLDENDNSPVFDQIAPKQITENCGIHATVAVVRATDRDAGDYGRVSYAIVSENGGNAVTFEIGGSVSRATTPPQ